MHCGLDDLAEVNVSELVHLLRRLGNIVDEWVGAISGKSSQLRERPDGRDSSPPGKEEKEDVEDGKHAKSCYCLVLCVCLTFFLNLHALLPIWYNVCNYLFSKFFFFKS